MASDLEIRKGRRDFPIGTLPLLRQRLLCLKGCRVFVPKVLEKETAMFGLGRGCVTSFEMKECVSR